MAYYEIFEGVISSFTAASIFAPIQHLVQCYMGVKPGDSEPQTQDQLISIPLAIGYYYNLVEKIDYELASNNMMVKKHVVRRDNFLDRLNLSEKQIERLSSDELVQLKTTLTEHTEHLGSFGIEDVFLELIFPKDLGNASLNNCSRYLFSSTQKGSIESAVSGRPYGIDYQLDADNNLLYIIDYVRPIEAIPKFYREMKGIGGYGTNNDEWAEIEEKEMQAFLYALTFMIHNRSRFLYDKVIFRPLDNHI